MKKIKIFTPFLLMFITFKTFAQQEAQYSQYMFNGLYINPAYAGYKEDFYLHSFYRTQWTGLEGAPKSFSASVDGSFSDAKVGLGLMVSQDKIGAQRSSAAYLNYAYRLQMGADFNNRLAFGIGVGVIQAGIDGTQLNAIEDGDSYIPATYQSKIIPDARAGVFYSNEKMFVGFSADNLFASSLKRDNSLLVPIPKPHFYLTAGTIITMNDDVKFRPSILLKDDIAGPTSLDLNAFTLLKEKVWLGASYRTGVPLYPKENLQKGLDKTNSIVGMVQFFAGEKLRVGYSYDHTLNSLADYKNGSHEISIGLFFGRGEVMPNTNRCYF